jgi:hypothetical protein
LSFVKPNALPARAIALAGCLLLLALNSGVAQGEDNIEFKIKTAYLYNFTKFIAWPEKISSTFDLCIIGDSPIKSMLASLENKTVLDKPIRIRYFDSVNQIADCHIAYFERVEPPDGVTMNTILLASQLNKTLTVSSQDRFAEQGGMIGFVLEDEKLKLHINLPAIKRQGLNISAKLIEVASQVKGAEDE